MITPMAAFMVRNPGKEDTPDNHMFITPQEAQDLLEKDLRQCRLVIVKSQTPHTTSKQFRAKMFVYQAKLYVTL